MRAVRTMTAALALFAAACGGGSSSGPSPVAANPAVHTITPSSGTAAGGTPVTIRGQRFAAGATVTIGGRAASDVTVQGEDVITARTPPAATPGVADVVVAVGGRTAILNGGFTYETPAPNTAPVIKSLVGQADAAGRPPNFVDRGQTLRLTAVVEDAETSPDRLMFEWKACDGTFSGSGAQVDWRPPDTLPASQTCAIDLTVVDGEHRVTRSLTVDVHDSPKEIEELALEFLEDFSDSSVPPETAVRHFSDSCRGKELELEDVKANRASRVILSFTHGPPVVSVTFGGACAYQNRRADGCVATPVEWRSTIKQNGQAEITTGTSYITAVYEASRWWLCDSEFAGTSTSGLRFIR